MLEALIRTKDSASFDKRKGDVICLKLKEFSEWGAMEQRVHMVTDWEDSEIELEMRESFNKTGIPPVFITPYKKTSEQEVFDNNGNKIYSGEITITRSEQYFNLDTGEKLEKTSSQITQEFEENVEAIKAEVLKEKPKPEAEEQMTSEESQKVADEYSNYLLKLQKDLSKYNIKTQIIDGKLVRV